MTLVMIICVVAIIGVNMLFAWLIKAPTLHGRKIMDEIEGLKMYLSTAEKEVGGTGGSNKFAKIQQGAYDPLDV